MNSAVTVPFVSLGMAQALSPDIVSALGAGGRTVSFHPGEVIYAEGDPTEHWYEVVSGAVRTCKLAADGRRQVVEIHLSGDVFGLDGAGTHGHWAEASAEGLTVLVRRCRRRLDTLAEADLRLARWLRDIALRDLERAQARLFLLGCPAAERIAVFLLKMENCLAPRGGRAAAGFTLPLTRGDIADHLGLTKETVSRTLQALRRAGLIAVSGSRQVRILDHRALGDLDKGSLVSAAESWRGHGHPRFTTLAA